MMGFFKKKVIKEIEGGVWGHLVNDHKIDVDTISKELGLFKKNERGSFREEEMMEAMMKTEQETVVHEEKKMKRKWFNRFLNFLMYGGWLLVAMLFFGLIILSYTISPDSS